MPASQTVDHGGADRSWTLNSREEARVEGLEEPVTIAVELGESSKSVDQLLSASSDGGGSKSSTAKQMILDVLERDGEQESDALDARIAKDADLAAGTVRQLRAELKHEGLVRSYPEKDETGAIVRWLVSRTMAPREGAQRTVDLHCRARAGIQQRNVHWTV